MYLYIFMYIYMYVFVYVYIYIYTHEYIYIRTHLHTCVYIYTYSHIYTGTHGTPACVQAIICCRSTTWRLMGCSSRKSPTNSVVRFITTPKITVCRTSCSYPHVLLHFFVRFFFHEHLMLLLENPFYPIPACTCPHFNLNYV